MLADVCFVVGTRPNFMKVAPVHAALRARSPDLRLLLVHTGQHYDPEMSDVFLEELGLPAPDVRLAAGGGSHAEQTARALLGVERVLIDSTPRAVVVAGDVNSTLAGALAAVKLEIPVAHIEAGLRSYDPTMPEEHNRRVVDHLSSLLLVHSESAIQNLAREGIEGGVLFVGNTMIDSLTAHLGQARERRTWTGLGLEPGGFGLVTLHRPNVVDDPTLLAETVVALRELAETTRLVFPVHPRTRQRLEEAGSAGDLGGVLLTPPLGYFDFLALESAAQFVLTDSGGVQEETSALGVPCFTLRDVTERPVTVECGTNTVLGLRPESIGEIPLLLERSRNSMPIPLWDGHAGERAADALAEFIAGTRAPAPVA
jgi:UDP-N-acetylglucosamine 2-epimerase (non-hydrolysing)